MQPWVSLMAALTRTAFVSPPIGQDGANAMLLAWNPTFAAWGRVFGDQVVATAIVARRLYT